jgi:hypothetical protein
LRIGTWNLAGRWSGRHHLLLHRQECDVWLLTEVSERVMLHGWNLRCTVGHMAPARHWAAVASQQPMIDQGDPHPASAAAIVDGVDFCSSILPWRSCGTRDGVWVGERHGDRTSAAVDQLSAGWPTDLPIVWGGDWNHALEGPEVAGSRQGRERVQACLQGRALQVPTQRLPHRLPDGLTVDHIAVPQSWTAVGSRVDASGLSDHDLYVVQADPPS